jgi:hypothetical protein
MKAIDLAKEKYELSHIFNFARTETVLLLTKNGEEFIISRADDFESEVEALRSSPAFQTFLEKRSKCKVKFSIEELEKEIDEELSNIDKLT